jgi:hypothetical protein
MSEDAIVRCVYSAAIGFMSAQLYGLWSIAVVLFIVFMADAIGKAYGK